MSAEKRAASNAFGSSQMVVKRQKSDANLGNGNAVAVANAQYGNGALIQSTAREGRLMKRGIGVPDKWPSSSHYGAKWYTANSGFSTFHFHGLPFPGHTGEVFATRFDPTGNLIASGSMDRSISGFLLEIKLSFYTLTMLLTVLWRTYGQCDNYGILTGHKGAVLDLHWSRDSRVIFSASADMTIASWDLESGLRIRRHIGHEEVVNCLDVSRRGGEMLVTGSDDAYIGIWDPRQKQAIEFIETGFPVTSVALAEAGNEIFSGGIDNDIKVWDLRKKAVAYSMTGHTDTVTSLQVSPDTQSLLSNSHDGTVRTWDIRPFAPTDRHIRTYDGAPAGIERNLIRASWDRKGKKIAAGSGDRSVVVWDVRTGKLLNKLPGHKGTVNDVRFSPGDEPISKYILVLRLIFILILGSCLWVNR
ncbi:hypothetical protein MMC13_005023 [Lambiella insularis]|nr:hypothetical protein [Lambiella insularis]